MHSTERTDERAAIRVYLIDDQTMIRAGLRSLLGKDPRFEVLGDTGDPRQGITQVAELRPDVLLLDISMPELSGLDVLPQVRKLSPRTRVVMVTHHEGDMYVEQALRAGADGYLSKDSEPGELTLAIEAVHRGQMFLSPKVAGSLLQRGRGPAGGARPGGRGLSDLTPREREVFQLLAVGKSNKEVARTLDMSLGTAKKHRENLQRKLDCHSAAELALLAIREGLISI